MWKELVNDFRNRGWTLQQIGDSCGLHKVSIHDLSTGLTKEPKYEAATKLLKEHKLLMSGRNKHK